MPGQETHGNKEWEEASMLFHTLKWTPESSKGIEMILAKKREWIEESWALREH